MIAGVGDRRDEDIIELARIAGSMFQHIVVRQEHGLRGRTLDEINKLMVKGIEDAGLNVTYDLIDNEKEAIRHALNIAQPGDFVVALSEMYNDVIEAIEDFNSK